MINTIKATIIYSLHCYRGISGQQVGADGSGDYLIFVTGETFEEVCEKVEVEIKKIKSIARRYQSHSINVYYKNDDGYYYDNWKVV